MVFCLCRWRPYFDTTNWILHKSTATHRIGQYSPSVHFHSMRVKGRIKHSLPVAKQIHILASHRVLFWWTLTGASSKSKEVCVWLTSQMDYKPAISVCVSHPALPAFTCCMCDHAIKQKHQCSIIDWWSHWARQQPAPQHHSRQQSALAFLLTSPLYRAYTVATPTGVSDGWWCNVFCYHGGY